MNFELHSESLGSLLLINHFLSRMKVAELAES